MTISRKSFHTSCIAAVFVSALTITVAANTGVHAQTASPKQTGFARPGADVAYDVSFDNAVHHETRITVTFRGMPAARPLHAVMSRTSPGRYAIHDFAKNVYDVTAVNGAGRKVSLEHTTPYEWVASGHDGTVKISYTVFADFADGTYAGVDSTHAHFNMPAAFMWARGFENRPVTITFHPRAGWKVATQLQTTTKPFVFTAPHLQYFMDSPTELSDYSLRQWTAGPNDRYTIRLAVHTIAPDSIIDRYAVMAKRVVAEEAAVWGTYPLYDDNTYTFLADYLPWVFGDGMEHRNSTIISSGSPLTAANMLGLLGTLVHEHFHAWNMERLRDKAIEPFDFENADMSPNLWFGEGFTQYYTPLIPKRAGYIDFATYARGLGGTINQVVNGPGRSHRSAVEMSQYAPFADAAVSNDPTNQQNTFISYYTYGAAIGLGLDLTLRSRFDKTLDGYMRALWAKYGSRQANYTPLRPYTTADLRITLGEYTGGPAFANDFFARYIEGKEAIDYAPLLARAGLVLRHAGAGRASAGSLSLQYDSTGATVRAPAMQGSAAYLAGIENGDRITEVDGKPLLHATALQALLNAHKPGDDIAVTFVQRGQLKRTTMKLQEDPRLEVVTYEDAGMQVTAEMTAFRNAWTGTQVK